jgi:hypothetical protein
MQRSRPLITALALEAAAVIVLYRFIREPGFAIPIAFGLAAWMLSSTLLYLIASVARIPGAIHAVGRVTLPVVRRHVDRAVAATILTGALVTGASPALAASAPAPDPVVDAAVVVAVPADEPTVPVAPAQDEPADDEPTTTTLPVRTGRAGDPAAIESASTTPEPASMSPAPLVPLPAPLARTPVKRTPGTHSTEPSVVTPAAPNVPSTPTARTPVAVATNAATSYTVMSGDNFWEIAARHLAEATGRERAALTDGEITSYWVRVCDENRNRIQSGDVNVIYTGEVVELPAI